MREKKAGSDRRGYECWLQGLCFNHSNCSTNAVISGVYIEQDTIENADNSNDISPKTMCMNGLHLTTELYIVLTCSTLQNQGNIFFNPEKNVLMSMCTRCCKQPSVAW